MTVALFRRIASACFLGLLAAGLPGQATMTRPVVPNPTSLAFAELQHDFGKVKDDHTVEWKFTFTNTASTPVAVTDVRTSCGCTTTTTAKKAYAPGEAGEITASFNPLGRQGKEKKTIKVVTDEGGSKEVELAILVEIIPRIGLDPPALFLGELRFDSVAPTNLKRPITLTSRVPGFEIKSVKLDDAKFTVKALDPVAGEADGDKVMRYGFELAPAANLPIGRHQTTLRIATNDAGRPEIAIPVILESIGDLRVSPTPVALQMADEGVAVDQVITVMARNQKPFKVLEATATSPQMTLTTQIEQVAPNSELVWRVHVKGTSPAAGVTVTGSLKVKTDAVTEPEIDIPITGYVLRPTQKH